MDRDGAHLRIAFATVRVLIVCLTVAFLAVGGYVVHAVAAVRVPGVRLTADDGGAFDDPVRGAGRFHDVVRRERGGRVELRLRRPVGIRRRRRLQVRGHGHCWVARRSWQRRHSSFPRTFSGCVHRTDAISLPAVD